MTIRLLCMATLVVALAACGGSGGGSGSAPPPPPPPDFSITAPTQVQPAAPAQFGTTITQVDGLTFAWDFGDGTKGDGPTPTHTFASSGNYHVQVAVTNGTSNAAASTDVTARYYSHVDGLDCTRANDEGWCWQDALFTGEPILAAAYPAGGSLYAVGSGGTILRSSDMGQTWSHQVSGLTSELWDVAFRDPTHGFAISLEGEGAVTSDGGNTWSSLSVLANPWYEPVQIVAFDDSQIVVNVAGVSAVSHDAGATFVQTPLFATFVAGQDCWHIGYSVEVMRDCTGTPVWKLYGDGQSIFYLRGNSDPGGSHIVVVREDENSDPPVFSSLVSDDGGETFTAYPLDALLDFPFMRALVVPDTTHAWILPYAGQGAYMLASSDGGQTFATVIPGSYTPLFDHVSGLIDGTGWPFYIDSAKMTLSQDGVDWAVLPTPDPQVSYDFGHTARVFRWDGVASLLVQVDDLYFRTEDAGKHWTQLLGPNPSDVGASFAIAFADASHGTLVNSNGSLQTTADGGHTWSRRETAVHGSPAVHFTSANTGWMLLGGRVWQTQDAGTTWTQVESAGFITAPVAMSWPDAQHGWVLQDQALVATQDGGGTWRTVSLAGVIDPSGSAVQVAFESATTGLVVWGEPGNSGSHPYFTLQTFDGGASWHSVLHDQSNDISIAHGGSHTFWCAYTFDQAVFVGKSLDGGLTWTFTNVAPYIEGVPRIFGGADDNHAWLFAYDHLLATSDAGGAWQDLGAPPMGVWPEVNYADLAVFDSMTAWLVTGKGNVAATISGG